MIPQAYITEWRSRAPWVQNAWVEQDLIIGRALVEIFRDLFDLWHALDEGLAHADALITCFDRYMREGGHRVSRAQFEANLHAKRADPAFRADVAPMLRPGIDWDFDTAMEDVLEKLIARLPGKPWKGG